MKEFDYDLPYDDLDFTDPEVRPLYRIGRGEQGVLIVRPYTHIICEHWRFRNIEVAEKSSRAIYGLFSMYKENKDFIGMDMCRKFLEMGFTRARRYANHKSGQKYATKPPYYHTGDRGGAPILPQEKDALTNEKAQAASIFKTVRDIVATDPEYVKMRKEWREAE
jgi:hypothetical protein